MLGSYSGKYEGVICKDYVYYQSEDINRPDLCIIEWNGATGFDLPIFDNQIVDKCPFHITNDSPHTSIKGFTFNVKNCRYGLHIETVGAKVLCEWLIENCIFNWGGVPDLSSDDTTHLYAKPVVGTGWTLGEKGKFKNCVLNCTNTNKTNGGNHMIFQTHANSDNPNLGITVGEAIVFENCKFSIADGSEYCHFDLRSDQNVDYDIAPLCKLSNISSLPILITENGDTKKYTTIFEGAKEKVN